MDQTPLQDISWQYKNDNKHNEDFEMQKYAWY